MFPTPVLWLVVAIAAALVEALSLGLITLWFVVGALVAFVADLLGASLVVQVALFLVVSVLCLILLRPVFAKYRVRGQAAEPTVVGQRGVVCEKIDNARLAGRVELPDHMTWAARSVDGSPIEVGSPVVVESQESITLIVRPA